MKPPRFIRPLTDEERRQLAADRRTADACRVRRAQIVLASAQRLSPQPLAQLGGCSVHTVRNVLHAFNTQGVEGVAQPSTRPKTAAPGLDAPKCARLQPILPQSPRLYGTAPGVGTLGVAAAVCEEQGVTERLMRDETIRRALTRLETHGKRAKHWITSPAPHYARKKSGAIA
jgi:transposase